MQRVSGNSEHNISYKKLLEEPGRSDSQNKGPAYSDYPYKLPFDLQDFGKDMESVADHAHKIIEELRKQYRENCNAWIIVIEADGHLDELTSMNLLTLSRDSIRKARTLSKSWSSISIRRVRHSSFIMCNQNNRSIIKGRP
jgi:hypothetical protein